MALELDIRVEYLVAYPLAAMLDPDEAERGFGSGSPIADLASCLADDGRTAFHAHRHHERSRDRHDGRIPLGRRRLVPGKVSTEDPDSNARQGEDTSL